MGIFSMLKNNDAGIKLSKFKQSKMKDYLKGQLDPDNFKIVEGGACMTYTMEWLSQSLGGGPTKGSAARPETLRATAGPAIVTPASP